jgi:transcriptional regulator with XRE-family HTH domain
MDYHVLGHLVRNARGDLSLRAFAKKCNISHTHLESIEKGVDFRTGKPVRVSMDTLEKLSAGTGLPIDKLINSDETEADRAILQAMFKDRKDMPEDKKKSAIDDAELGYKMAKADMPEADMLRVFRQYYPEDTASTISELLAKFLKLDDAGKKYVLKSIDLSLGDSNKDDEKSGDK